MNTLSIFGALACCLLAIATSFWWGLIHIVLLFFKQEQGGSIDLATFLRTSDGRAIVVAHRGGQFEAPENTLLAIRTAHRNGAEAVEIDLAFTADKVAVVFHDDTLDRTTNGKGLLSLKTFSDLQSLDAAHSFSFPRDGGSGNGNQERTVTERIPTLEAAAKLCLLLKIKIFLDIKGDTNLAISELQRLNKKLPGIAALMLVTSFQTNLIYQVRRSAPAFSTALIWRHHYHSHTMTGVPYHSGVRHFVAELADACLEWAVPAFLPELIGASAVVLNKNALSRHSIECYHNQHIFVVAWTVNNPTEKEYFNNRLAIPIITDCVLESAECQEQTG